MKCPFCEQPDTRVTDSRSADDGESIRRRRECTQCRKRFTTYETVEVAPLIIVKRNGRREQFDRNKLLTGILRACDKRFVPIDVMEGVVNDVERQLRNVLKGEVSSEMLGELVLDLLRHVDQVAYVRFASVYRKFDNIDSFKNELDYLKTITENKIIKDHKELGK